MSSVIAKTALTGLQSLTSMTVTSAINSVHLDEKGKLGFSGNAFESQFKGGLGGLVGGMTSTFTSGLMGQMNLFDGNSLGLSDKIFNTDGIKGFNSFVGGIASQGVQYAMGGDFTLNVLNFGMFGIEDANKNLVSQGLFELRFGRDGFRAGIGMGGMDASYGAIANAMSGLQDTVKIGSAKVSSLFGKYEGISTLNAVNMLGYTSDGFNHQLGKDIWSGNIQAKYGDIGEAYGQYNSNNPAEILMNQALLGGGMEAAAMLASVISHEGTHARVIDYEYAAHQQGLSTYAELLMNQQGWKGMRR